MATFVTGDLHGAVDFGKIDRFEATRAGEVAPGDRLVILGDFGLVWGPRTPAQEAMLSRLSDGPWAEVLFVDGNHEDFDALDALPVEGGWHGGRVQRVPGHPTVIHLMRGEVYDMGEDGTWLAMGGARSTDRAHRVEHVSWWARELPSEEERRHCEKSLDAVGWRVGHVLTHDCPASCVMAMQAAIGLTPAFMDEPDANENWLQWLDDRLEYGHWWYGHWHVDMDLGDGHTCLYGGVVPLGGPAGAV